LKKRARERNTHRWAEFDGNGNDDDDDDDSRPQHRSRSKKKKKTKSKKKELEARMTKVISDYTAQLTERTEHHMG